MLWMTGRITTRLLAMSAIFISTWARVSGGMFHPVFFLHVKKGIWKIGG
jgi:hypothetical protein